MKFQIKVAFISILCCVLIMEVTAGRSSSSSSKSSSSKSSSSSSSKPCEPKPLKRRVKWLEKQLKNLQDRQDAAEKERGLISDIVKQCKEDLANLQSKVQAKCGELQEKLVEVNDKVDSIMDDLNPCKDNPCQNGGICKNPIDNYQCTCNEPWTGEDCSEQDPCSAETPPCLHGGTCTAKDEPPFYECDCINGYTGDTCDTHLCSAETPPCLHGGTCTAKDEPPFYECDCINGYTGDTCETHVCDDNPCENGGICSATGDGYECDCKQGFQGINCEEVMDPCNPNPCHDHTCLTIGATDYECDCGIETVGKDCSIPIYNPA